MEWSIKDKENYRFDQEIQLKERVENRTLEHNERKEIRGERVELSKHNTELMKAFGNKF
jgi:hypothetical protein